MEIRLTARGLCLATPPGPAYHADWFDDAYVANSRPNNAWFLISSLLCCLSASRKPMGKQMLIRARAAAMSGLEIG